MLLVLEKLLFLSQFGSINGHLLLINPLMMVLSSQMLSNFTELVIQMPTNKDMLVSSFQDVLHSSLKLHQIKLLLFLMLLVSNVGFMVHKMVMEIFSMFFIRPLKMLPLLLKLMGLLGKRMLLMSISLV